MNVGTADGSKGRGVMKLPLIGRTEREANKLRTIRVERKPGSLGFRDDGRIEKFADRG